MPVPMVPASQPKYQPDNNPEVILTIITQVEDQSMDYPEDPCAEYDQYKEQGYQGEVGGHAMSTDTQGTEGNNYIRKVKT